MGTTEKLSLVGVALVVIILFVWSLGSDDPSHAREASPDGGASAGASQTAFVQPPGSGTPSATPTGGGPTGGDLSPYPSDGSGVSEALAGPMGRKIELEAPGSHPGAEGGGNGLLFADVTTGEQGPRAGSGNVRRLPDWDLVEIADLESTLDPHMLAYRPRPEDTWESLARRFYGSESRAELLRHNNEGMDTPGNIISVPAKDDLGEAAGVLTVQVQRGETLWEVARRTLGDGARWKDIYDANRDVISDPNYLVPGTMLTIR